MFNTLMKRKFFEYRSQIILVTAIFITNTAVICTADEVYRILNEDGSYTFTDIPPGGAKAEKFVVPEPNLVPALKQPEPQLDIDIQTEVPKKQTKQNTSKEQTPTLDVEKALYELTIFSPLDETVFKSSSSFVKIDLGISPALSSQHLIYVLLNGKQYGSGGNVLTRLIPSLPIGTHNISAVAKTKSDDKVVARADAITIKVEKELDSDPTNDANEPTFEKAQ